VRRSLFAAALALVAVAASSAPRTSEAQSPLVLGTASVGGTYNIYGDVVARILTDKARLQIVPQQTQGPNQNVILIDDGKIGLGMTTMGV
ncbi:TAXI family TRAP transporter solute-binding subunit, partial [Escherichia coli]|uniref:TAXI family TRAP transporter solute-binding subunit n=1 Tax=Escherichia coli TaxID=562 RepID=UPI001BDD82EE